MQADAQADVAAPPSAASKGTSDNGAQDEEIAVLEQAGSPSSSCALAEHDEDDEARADRGGVVSSSASSPSSEDPQLLRDSGSNVGVDAASTGLEQDGLGVKGFLSMRDEGVTYHRMKRYYCRCVGVNFFRFYSREAASVMANALMGAEIQKVESWDGKGLWHTYRNSFKLYFTTGAVFNVDADTEDDKRKWIEYLQVALRGVLHGVKLWRAHAGELPEIMALAPGGLAFADKKLTAPKFHNRTTCEHPNCVVRFDGAAGKRQHHCRNCGGSVCSDHSSKFALLRHFMMNESVRLCTSCYRVQRFIMWLTMLVQRLSTALVQPVKVPVLAKEEEDELAMIQSLLSESMVGISDVIQVLHLHRHGCDEAYALIVNKLLELSASNLPDFEFFLPQLFHMWLTVDWTTNNIKGALLFRVICYAAHLHVRLATSIYWLTRAAIDDSCGWGFGQSEQLIPEFLFRKLSACKLLMINLEMQLAKRNWRFTPDKDIPASELQSTLITCLFDRVLVLLESATNGPATALGAVCDAVSLCALPAEFVQPSRPYIQDRPDDNSDERAVFEAQIECMRELCDMTERLRHCAVDQRKAALKQELEALTLPDEAFCPLGSCQDTLQRLVKIARGEGTVFTTRARAPTLIFFEVEAQSHEDRSSPWLQRARALTLNWSTTDESGSEDLLTNGSDTSSNGITSPTTGAHRQKNAIELATSSDIGQALTLNELVSDSNGDDRGMKNRGESGRGGFDPNDSMISVDDDDNDDDEERYENRDRVESNPTPPPAPLATKPKKKKPRRRSGSLMNATTKSLDTIIAVYSDKIGKSRRRRSVSEGTDFDTQSGSQESSMYLPNEVEKFTKDQLVSMAQNLEISLLKEKPTCRGVFTGEEIVVWMTQNEIVSDENHAKWLGNELITGGAIEAVGETASTSSKFLATSDASYRLRSEATTIKKQHRRHEGRESPMKGPRSGTDRASRTSHLFRQPPSSASSSRSSANSSSFLLGSPRAKDMNVSSLATAIDASFPSLPTIKSSSQLVGSIGEEGEDELRSTVTMTKAMAFFQNFQPEVALAAMQSVESAMMQHVLSNQAIDNVNQLSEDLQILREQMDVVYEYVVDKRKKLHSAVETAFGESFEEKRERLRMASQYLELRQTQAWDCVAFIVKSNDDLRQEVLCQQLIRQLQDIFTSADLPLRLLPYSIIATSASTGMIEYVKNATSLDALKKRHGYTTLANHFLNTYGRVDSAAYKTAMTNFVRSMAAYSLACYFLQIKDRHNGNIMIDSEGHVVHIDFGFILGIAPGGRFSLETAPFKLTAEMVDAMGGTQSEYFKAYVIFLIQGFLALQVRSCRLACPSFGSSV